MLLRRLIAPCCGLLAFSCLLVFVAPAVATVPTPQKIFAIVHSDISNFGNPEDTLNFYDVTDIGTGSAVFDTNSDGFSDPLFSVWTGFEIFSGDTGGGFPTGNAEDPSAIAVNHANGTIYMAAFDSGGPAAGFPNPDPNQNPDQVGDMQGDWDLFRIDYQVLLDDFVTNSRPKGTVYAPRFLDITITDETNLQGSPLFDGTIDGQAENIPHPDTLSPFTPPGLADRPTVNIDNAITKVGELARAQGGIGAFFDTELDFIDPATLLVMDTATADTQAGDFQIRTWNRVSTNAGAATIDPDGPDNILGNEDDQQGGRNGQSVQSWESQIVGRLEMDAASASEPRGLGIVNRDGVLGVWVADGDGSPTQDGGDDVSFFEIDLTGPTPTLTKKELFQSGGGGPFPTAFALDEDPSAATNTNDGEVDFLAIDKDGNLVIGESGFFDTIMGSATPPLGNGDETAEEPRVITLDIADYSGASITPGGPAGTGFNDTAPWTTSASVPAGGLEAGDDDVLNIQSVAYDRGTGFIYFIDRDDDFIEDLYVFDPAAGTIVHSEVNGLDPGFFNTSSLLIFVRGDLNDDGSITYGDIIAMEEAIADPTQGGKFSSDVGQEFYDLTGDGLLTQADLDELVVEILGTSLGDFDLDGDVDDDDLTVEWEPAFGVSFNGKHFLDWQRNFGFTNMPPLTAVPEPTSLVIMIFGGLAGVSTVRRRKS